VTGVRNGFVTRMLGPFQEFARTGALGGIVLLASVSFGIMPLFALANAGVRVATFGDALSSPVAYGIALGLLLGKTIGITLFAWLAVRAGVATLPAGVGWSTLCCGQLARRDRVHDGALRGRARVD